MHFLVKPSCFAKFRVLRNRLFIKLDPHVAQILIQLAFEPVDVRTHLDIFMFALVVFHFDVLMELNYLFGICILREHVLNAGPYMRLKLQHLAVDLPVLT